MGGGGGGLESVSFSFLGVSELMSGFSMSMYACMSVMADSDAPETKRRSTVRRVFLANYVCACCCSQIQ